jgi:hypothetical protein
MGNSCHGQWVYLCRLSTYAKLEFYLCVVQCMVTVQYSACPSGEHENHKFLSEHLAAFISASLLSTRMQLGAKVLCPSNAVQAASRSPRISLKTSVDSLRTNAHHEVHRALDRLSSETEGGGEGCQGMEGPHGGCLGTLEKGIICECDQAGQAHFRHLLQGLLQGQRKKQWPEGVALPHRPSRRHIESYPIFATCSVHSKQLLIIVSKASFAASQTQPVLCGSAGCANLLMWF